MTKKTITVTEAARNFVDCVNRARCQNVTFVLVKTGIPVARLTPPEKKVCTGRDLAEVLDRVRLTEVEARTWRRDLQTGRNRLKAATDSRD